MCSAQVISMIDGMVLVSPEYCLRAAFGSKSACHRRSRCWRSEKVLQLFEAYERVHSIRRRLEGFRSAQVFVRSSVPL